MSERSDSFLSSVAALASVGAGAIHCAVAGVHAEHVTLARLFVLTGVVQIAVGAWNLSRPGRLATWAMVVVNLIAVGAWATSRVTSVWWIDGLGQREPVGMVDLLCALLGAVAVVVGLGAVLRSTPSTRPSRSLLIPALAVAVIAAPAVWSSTKHDHAEAAGHEHAAGAADHHTVTSDGGDASTESTAHSHSSTTSGATDDSATDTTAHAHTAAVVAPVPYDPTKPIDLGGVPGVTPEQQAAAENIVAETLIRLPQWADYRTAEAAGFRSIGDALTGAEHFVQWSWINDDVILNPNFPESLVFEPQPDGSKKLVSAMYMLPSTVALADVPDIGGPLMQWHIHDNLCFSKDPDQPMVRGITNAKGECPPSLQKFPSAPMIHVWITPHKCGPFAALEGLGAGQVLEGQDHACDAAHGGH